MKAPLERKRPAATGRFEEHKTTVTQIIRPAENLGNSEAGRERPNTTRTSPLDRVLPVLAKVRRRQPGQWSACCPAHEDKAPSLSVREAPDGAVLLHCFAGCSVDDVVGALGLEMHDLFPRRNAPAFAARRIPKAISAQQALELLHQEAQLVAMCAGNIGHGVGLTAAERERVLQAAGRIAYLLSEAAQ